MAADHAYRASSGTLPAEGQRVLLSPLCSERIHRRYVARVDAVEIMTATAVPGYLYLRVSEVLAGGQFGPQLRFLINIAGLVLYPLTSANTPTS